MTQDRFRIIISEIIKKEINKEQDCATLCFFPLHASQLHATVSTPPFPALVTRKSIRHVIKGTFKYLVYVEGYDIAVCIVIVFERG
jgi:hypothetical protein